VYTGLNDSEILKDHIPECMELIQHSNTELEAKVVFDIDSGNVNFGANVTLNLDTLLERLSLFGIGNCGSAEFAKRRSRSGI